MKSLKRDIDLETGEGTARSNVVLRCGDCLHYKGSPHPAMDKSCVHLGVRTTAIAPSCFTPNVSVLRKVSGMEFKTLAALLVGFKPQQARVLMGLLKGAGSLQSTGFHFLQKVYFRTGDDFLENYYSGYVLGVGPNKTLMIVGERYLSGSTSVPVAQLMKSSVLSWEAFKVKRDKLIAQGKFLEPKKLKRYASPDYEAPTLDSPPKEEEKGKRKKGKDNFTVVDETRKKS